MRRRRIRGNCMRRISGEDLVAGPRDRCLRVRDFKDSWSMLLIYLL